MITAGQMYRDPVHNLIIAVTRVARDRSWADITVQNPAATGVRATWRKRQALTAAGEFPFTAELETPTGPPGPA